MRTADYTKKITAMVTALFMLALIIFPERYIHSVSKGLNLYAVAVLPALFPFFFFTKVITSLGVTDNFRALDKPMKLLFNSPPAGGYIFLMAILSGYPVGAKMTADFYERGVITRTQAKIISAFTSTSGPLFIVGTVGISMFLSKEGGFILLISHYLSALINGLLYKNAKEKSEKTAEKVQPKITLRSGNILGDSITDSVLSVAIVGGYIAIFSMILDVLIDIKAIALLAKGIGIILPEELSFGLISSLVEITRGCKELSLSGMPLKFAIPAASFAITFGGLSVTLQSMTFLAKCKIHPAYYLITKFTQGVIAFALASLFCLFL